MIDLLVIGCGLLGRAMAISARKCLQTAVTYHTHPLPIDGCATYQMNITRDVDIIKALRPQYIVLTAAMTNVDACEMDQKQAWEVNALGPRNVAMATRDIGAKLIYVSTDYVFDGERGRYREEEPTTPINYYGKSKLAGELFIQDILDDYLIARTSVLYGWSPSRLNFATWAIEEMKQKKIITIVNDQFNSPTFAENLADMILCLRDESGVFHTAGSERINRFDFTLKIARTFGLDDSLIVPITSDALSWKARRPKDSSLDVSSSSRFSKPLNATDGLKAMKMAYSEDVRK